MRTGAPRVAVANAITSSDEFRMGLIDDAYRRYLGRVPEPAGMQHWLAQMRAGPTIAGLEAGFLGSDEYYLQGDDGRGVYGWTYDLYLDLLDRGPAPEEVVYWTELLYGGRSMYSPGLTREQVALGFLLSTEYLTGVVDGYYQYLLGRPLDASGLRTWVGRLQSGGRDEEIVGGIIASEEYWISLGR